MIDLPLITADTPIRLASRASKLALAQTEEVLRKLMPHHALIKTFSTRGDEVLDRSLADVGGKGLFIKTLEKAMLAGEADAAVHSAKDMENHFADGTSLVAFLEREDRRDALIGAYRTLSEIPQGSILGTASVRRSAIIQSIRPDLKIKLLRGNVNSRLQQLADGHYDAIILAMAGLNRLGISQNVHPIAEDIMLPAAGQGVVAIQAVNANEDPLRAQMHTILSGLNHHQTAVEITAERAVLATLDGTCHTPVAASAHFDGDIVQIKAQLMSLDGRIVVTAEASGHADDVLTLGHDCGQHLLAQVGGRDFILAQQPPVTSNQ